MLEQIKKEISEYIGAYDWFGMLDYISTISIKLYSKHIIHLNI